MSGNQTAHSSAQRGEPQFKADFTPCVELAWRQASPFWGNGYVSEAARECGRFAFDVLGEARVYAFTTASNARSRAVMERIGMTYVANGDFDHPKLPAGHRLCRHVLYRLDAPAERHDNPTRLS